MSALCGHPSLTPTEDKVRAAIARRVDVPLDALAARRRRVTYAIGDARGIVQAQEHDRGASTDDFMDAYILAIACDVALVAKSHGDEGAGLLLSCMVAKIVDKAFQALRAEDFGADPDGQVIAEPMARA